MESESTDEPEPSATQSRSTRESAEAITQTGRGAASAVVVPATAGDDFRRGGGARGLAVDAQTRLAEPSLHEALERVFAAGQASTAELPGGIIRVDFDADLSFDFNSDEPGAALRGGLSALAEVLRVYRQTTLTVVGHTDDVGAEALNRELSQRRAQAVAGYLEAQGISGQRLRTDGRGATQPRTANDSNLSRRLNRRVEIYIAPLAQQPRHPPLQRTLVVPLLSQLERSILLR